jgi:hypothetical protein
MATRCLRACVPGHVACLLVCTCDPHMHVPDPQTTSRPRTDDALPAQPALSCLWRCYAIACPCGGTGRRDEGPSPRNSMKCTRQKRKRITHLSNRTGTESIGDATITLIERPGSGSRFKCLHCAVDRAGRAFSVQRSHIFKRQLLIYAGLALGQKDKGVIAGPMWAKSGADPQRQRRGTPLRLSLEPRLEGPPLAGQTPDQLWAEG